MPYVNPLAAELNRRESDKSENAACRESVEFRLPNGTSGTMTGDTKEDVFRRIDVLRAFYRCCELTNETHTVVMPNGLPIAGVPIGYTVQDIFELANAMAAIHDQLNDFPLCQKLQSNTIH